MHCGMQFFVLKINKLFFIQNGFGIASSVLTYPIDKLGLCLYNNVAKIANIMVQNHLISLTINNVLHLHFSNILQYFTDVKTQIFR